MSIINKDRDPFIGVILTEYGKKQLALGQLQFKYYAFGDSDIDYNSVDIHSATLKPYVGFSDIKTPLRKGAGEIFYDITDENIQVTPQPTNYEYIRNVYTKKADNIYTLDDQYMKFNGVVKNIVNEYIVEIEFDNQINENDIVDYDYIVFNVFAQRGIIVKDKAAFINRCQISTIERITESKLRLILKQPISELIVNSNCYITKFANMFTQDPTWNQVYLGGSNLKTNETRFGGIIQYFEEEHGLLVYSNQMISNSDLTQSGDKDIEIEIFDVFWSKSPTQKMGLKLKSHGEPKQFKSKTNTNFSLIYYELIDDYKNVVGKYFPDIKCFIISDPELSTTLADKNRRNWTLPKFNFDYIPSNGNGVFNKTTDDLYLTYRISGNYHNNTNYCQYVEKVEYKKNDLQLELDFTKFNLKLMNNNNWIANEVHILFQYVKPGKKPNINNWYEIPMIRSEKLTENNIKGKYNMGVGHLLKGSKYTIDKVFNMDEQPFLGNVKLKTKSLSYKTTFSFDSKNNTKLYTKNPTYSNNKPIRISEVAIYDEKYNVVGLVKLSHSIKWRSDVSFTIKGSLIF